MSDKTKEYLERQAQPQNPLMAILIGKVAALDDALDMLRDFNAVGKKGKVISKTLQKFITEQKASIEKMAEADLFIPMTLKVQAPLISNTPDAPYLVYNEDRSLTETITIDDGCKAWFRGDPKMYVKARLWSDGTLQLVRRVKDQSW